MFDRMPGSAQAALAAAEVEPDIARCKLTIDELIGRYTAEGVVTAPDADLIRQLAPATLLIRVLVTGEPVEDDLLLRLVDNVMLPLLAPGRYPRCR